jgi:hypothetical protein
MAYYCLPPIAYRLLDQWPQPQLPPQQPPARGATAVAGSRDEREAKAEMSRRTLRLPQ